jgi:hypothetical protein
MSHHPLHFTTANLWPNELAEGQVPTKFGYWNRGNQAYTVTPEEREQQRSAFQEVTQPPTSGDDWRPKFPNIDKWAGQPLPPGSRTPMQDPRSAGTVGGDWRQALHPMFTSEPGFGFAGAPRSPSVLANEPAGARGWRAWSAEQARTTDTGGQRFAFDPDSPLWSPPPIFDTASLQGLGAWGELIIGSVTKAGNWVNGIWRPEPRVYDSEEQRALETALTGRDKYQTGMPFTSEIDVQRSDETWHNIAEFQSGNISYNELLENLNNTFNDRSFVQQMLADIMSAGPGFLAKMLTKNVFRNIPLIIKAANLDPTSPSTFIGTLRPLKEVMGEVSSPDNPLVRSIAGRTGVNPSALTGNSVAGRALIAYNRQMISAGELAEVAVSAALDVHAQKWTGRIGGLLPIDKDGFFGDTGALWQTVFGNPGKYPSLNLKTREYITDFNQVVKEVEDLRVAFGLDPRAKGLGPGEYYVPRQVQSVRGLKLEVETNPSLERIYKEAEEGFANGVRYSTDPRATLSLHVNAAYREVIEKQLSDVLEPISYLVDDLVDSPVLRHKLIMAKIAKDKAEAQVERVRVPRVDQGDARPMPGTLEGDLPGVTPASKRPDAPDMPGTLEGDLSLSAKLPAHLAGAKSRYNIGQYRSYTPQFESDLDKAFFIVAQKARSTQDGKYMAWLREQLPGWKDSQLREAGREVRDYIKTTVKGLESGDVPIPYSGVAGKGPSTRVGMGGTITQVEKDLREALEPKRKAAQENLRAANEAYYPLKEEWDKAKGIAENTKFYTANRDGALWGANQGETISIAKWGNRFFREEDAVQLEEGLKKAVPMKLAMQTLKTTGDLVRFLSTVGDFAMPLTHGLLMLARNPEAWGKMTFRHYQAFFDPTVQSRLIRDRIGTYQKMAQHGVPIGDPEFFAIMRAGESFSPGRLLELLPKGEETRRLFQQAGRQTFGRYQSSYNAGLGSARALLWESLETSWKGTDAELAQYIRNMTGGLDSRALGIGPDQRIAEGMWLAFSPRLLRSTVALMNDALGGAVNLAVPGRRASAVQVESLRSMAQLVSGATATYVMTGLALGKSWDEIKTGLNPLSGKKFLSHQINGDWIGIGGQVRATAQFLAQMYSTLAPGGKPLDDLLATNQFDNPLISVYVNRAAPSYNIAAGVVEATTGLDVLPFENIDSLPDLGKHIFTSAVPFTLAGMAEGEGKITSLLSQVGLRTSAETPYEKRDRLQEEVGMGMGFSGPLYSLEQQREINEDPRMVDIKKRIKDLSRKRRNPVATYIRDTEDVKVEYEGRVSKIVEFFDTEFDDDGNVFTGRDFRRQLRKFQTDRSDDNKDLRESDAGKEAQELFKSQDKVQHIENVALSDYYDIVFADPPLDNELTDNFDHAEWERRKKVWEDKYDPGTIQNVLTHMRTRNHERVQEYYADIDSPVMQYYWNVADAVVANAVESKGPQAQKDYEDYLAAHPEVKTAIGKRGVTNKILRDIGKVNQAMRCQSEDLERKLLRWGYATATVMRNGKYCHPSIANELAQSARYRIDYKASLDANQAVVGAE